MEQRLLQYTPIPRVTLRSMSAPGLANIPTCKESIADVSEAIVELGTERDSGWGRQSGSGNHQSAGSQPQKRSPFGGTRDEQRQKYLKKESGGCGGRGAPRAGNPGRS